MSTTPKDIRNNHIVPTRYVSKKMYYVDMFGTSRIVADETWRPIGLNAMKHEVNGEGYKTNHLLEEKILKADFS